MGISEISFANWFFRVEANMRIIVQRPGLLKIASRIRPHGTEQWVAEQHFVVPVEVSKEPAPAGAKE